MQHASKHKCQQTATDACTAVATHNNTNIRHQGYNTGTAKTSNRSSRQARFPANQLGKCKPTKKFSLLQAYLHLKPLQLQSLPYQWHKGRPVRHKVLQPHNKVLMWPPLQGTAARQCWIPHLVLRCCRGHGVRGLCKVLGVLHCAAHVGCCKDAGAVLWAYIRDM
jgi:hypothetical protein